MSSVHANIAEGCGRDSEAELKRFLDISHGSASETDYHLQLAADLSYLSEDAYHPLAREISELKRMIGVFSGEPSAVSAQLSASEKKCRSCASVR